MTKYIILSGSNGMTELKYGRVYSDVNEAFAARDSAVDAMVAGCEEPVNEYTRELAKTFCKVYKIEEALGN